MAEGLGDTAKEVAEGLGDTAKEGAEGLGDTAKEGAEKVFTHTKYTDEDGESTAYIVHHLPA